MYKLELLQAINDWQSSGMGKNKTQIAERIIEHSKELPLKFKKINTKCYRQLSISGSNSVRLGKEMQLPETYSSWTFDKNVAKSFNGGVPPSGKQGVIFEVDDDTENVDVILNLFELFKNSDFLDACENNKQNISSFNTGIGYFMNKESEVILKIKEIRINQIWAYGGYSSSKEGLAKQFFGEKPTKEQIKFLDKIIKEANVEIGAKWITGEAKDRTVLFHIEKAKKLTNRK